MRMSSAITYVFLVWAGLIAISLGFGEAVRHWAAHWTAGGHSEADLERERALAGEQDPGRPLVDAKDD
jgi:hypothetical protein